MLLIRGGRVIDPVREVDEIMDVMIEGSQIVETGKALKVPADAEVIDATGLVVGTDGCPCAFSRSRPYL